MVIPFLKGISGGRDRVLLAQGCEDPGNQEVSLIHSLTD